MTKNQHRRGHIAFSFFGLAAAHGLKLIVESEQQPDATMLAERHGQPSWARVRGFIESQTDCITVDSTYLRCFGTRKCLGNALAKWKKLQITLTPAPHIGLGDEFEPLFATRLPVP